MQQAQCLGQVKFYPEGVGFAILIMNAFTPILDKFFRPKVFGDRDEQLF